MNPIHPLLRWIWTVLWATALVCATTWWWIAPGGFAASHLKFAANTVIPILVVILAILGMLAAQKPSVPGLVTLAVVPVLALAAATATARTLFPVSFQRPTAWLIPAITLLGILAYWTRRSHPAHWGLTLVSATLALASGILWPLAQRAPRASTTPAAVTWIAPPQELGGERKSSTVALNESISFAPSTGEVILMNGAQRLRVCPLLDFMDGTPDRCWTILAPRGSARPEPRRLAVWDRSPLEVRGWYSGAAEHYLRIAKPDGLRVDLEARAKLPQARYSHLNSFTMIAWTGATRPRVRFSPCPALAEPIEIRAVEYPSGLPARAAYVDADGRFRVVEASSGEKGPFRVLSEGVQIKEAPLTLTLFSGEQAVFEITLHDFAAQASVAPSPTAGWGVPVNAIEFWDEGPVVILTFSLAGTSLGRGWDSVGHSAGVYRNRMELRQK